MVDDDSIPTLAHEDVPIGANGVGFGAGAIEVQLLEAASAFAMV